jgi:hypothetical protein
MALLFPGFIPFLFDGVGIVGLFHDFALTVANSKGIL